MNIKKLLDRREVRIDLGTGEIQRKGFISIDKRKLSHIDIVHDLEVIPYPLPDECVMILNASHVVEHLDPKRFIDIMNEWWRIMKVGGKLFIYTPAGGTSSYWQDPTHINGCNGTTWTYFDPEYELYKVYKPKPWSTVRNWRHPNDILEVVFKK